MSKVSQKEAVYSAVVSVLDENNIQVSGITDVNTLMNKGYRTQVNNTLFEGFKNGTIELEKNFNDTELRNYISGLQSNWLRKDKRLNGGAKYSSKNPGSRVGSSDPSLKAMKTLLSTLTVDGDRAEVQAAINTRISEIQASKVKSAVIDTSVLPTELVSKFIK